MPGYREAWEQLITLIYDESQRLDFRKMSETSKIVIYVVSFIKILNLKKTKAIRLSNVI